jgi:hypothetical protein
VSLRIVTMDVVLVVPLRFGARITYAIQDSRGIEEVGIEDSF